MSAFALKTLQRQLTGGINYILILPFVEELKSYLNSVDYYFELKKILATSNSFYMATQAQADKSHLQQNITSVIIEELNSPRSIAKEYLIFFKVYAVLAYKYPKLDFFGRQLNDQGQHNEYIQLVQKITQNQQEFNDPLKSQNSLCHKMEQLPWLKKFIALFKQLVDQQIITYVVTNNKFEQVEIDLVIHSLTTQQREKRRQFFNFFADTINDTKNQGFNDWSISSLCNNFSIHVAKEPRHPLEKLQGNFINPTLSSIDIKKTYYSANKLIAGRLPPPPPPITSYNAIKPTPTIDSAAIPSPFASTKLTKIATKISTHPIEVAEYEIQYDALTVSSALFEIRSITVQLLKLLYETFFMYALYIKHKTGQIIITTQELKPLHPWINSLYDEQNHKLQNCDIDSLIDGYYSVIETKLTTKEYFENRIISKSNSFWLQEVTVFWQRFLHHIYQYFSRIITLHAKLSKA